MAEILVIEDDQRIRELVCEHLARDGHSASSEANGLDGLRSLTADKPDALVLDLGLPDLDGIDLLRMVRSVTDLPVLVLTAREDEATILAAFAEGADDYVVKPISGPQLSARMAALLRRGGADAVDVIPDPAVEVRRRGAGRRHASTAPECPTKAEVAYLPAADPRQRVPVPSVRPPASVPLACPKSLAHLARFATSAILRASTTSINVV